MLERFKQVLASWQTHGAKLEAVQNIRDVLRVWQLHGNRINSFLEDDGAEANGGSGRLPSPSSRAVNGESSPLHPKRSATMHGGCAFVSDPMCNHALTEGCKQAALAAHCREGQHSC